MALSQTDMDKIKKIAEILHDSKRVFFVTGAGISADSGLPTYRGIGGLYNSNITEDGLSIEEAISGEMMRLNPRIPWKYLALIEKACRNVTFNRGHGVIAEMQRFFEVWVLTQNIDGLHRKAGSKNLIDIHGDLWDMVCTGCGFDYRVESYEGLDIPPYCKRCGGIIRPDVVLFGEMLSEEKCETISEQWQVGFDVVFSVGTTSVFPYIAQPVYFGRQYGIPTIEINPGETQVSDCVDIKIPGKAAETLEAIWSEFGK